MTKNDILNKLNKIAEMQLNCSRDSIKNRDQALEDSDLPNQLFYSGSKLAFEICREMIEDLITDILKDEEAKNE